MVFIAMFKAALLIDKIGSDEGRPIEDIDPATLDMATIFFSSLIEIFLENASETFNAPNALIDINFSNSFLSI